MKSHSLITAALTIAALTSVAQADDSWEVHNCAQIVVDLRKSNFTSADRNGKDVCVKSVATSGAPRHPSSSRRPSTEISPTRRAVALRGTAG